MPLSEYEQRVLEQMERHLATDDPRLANTLTQRGRRPVLRYVVAVVGSLVGLALLVLGVHASLVWVGVLGFVVMFAAVAFAFARPTRRAAPTPGAAPSGRTGRAARRTGLMRRMEDRWDRRRQQGDR